MGKLEAVNAMTDVTGFGLLGHLTEMAEASGVSARIYSDKIPILDTAAIPHYLSENCIPGGTHRNWESYGHKIAPLKNDPLRFLLCDPQTSGGLLVSVNPDQVGDFIEVSSGHGLDLEAVGEVTDRGSYLVEVV
jgi:selenide,water dikinase